MTATPVLQRAHLTRWSVTTEQGRHLWVDAPTGWHPSQDLPPARTLAGAGWLLTLPGRRQDGAVVHEVPWRPALLATLLLPAADVAERRDGTLVPAAETAGRFARSLHDGGVDVPSSEPDGATWLDRLREPRPGTLAAEPVWRALLATLDDDRRPGAAPVHGELRTDHLLVPSDGAGDDARLVVLGLPGGVRHGEAAADAGSLIGDLLELAILGSPYAAAAADAFRHGYDGSAPRDARFWARARAYGALKVVEHETRLALATGRETSSRSLTRFDSIARRLLPPDLLGKVAST